MAKAWQNADGLQVPFGNYWSDPTNFVNKAKKVSEGAAVVKQLIVDVDFTRIPTGTVSYSADLNNDGTADGFHDGDTRLPANASVLRAVFVASEAAVGGTSFTIGTYNKAGTAIAATGLFTATEGVIANINAIGKRTYGAGALVSTAVGTAGVGTANAYVGVSTTGTFTAGKGRLVIDYIDPTPEVLAD
jgi:hypothetical protein